MDIKSYRPKGDVVTAFVYQGEGMAELVKRLGHTASLSKTVEGILFKTARQQQVLKSGQIVAMHGPLHSAIVYDASEFFKLYQAV